MPEDSSYHVIKKLLQAVSGNETTPRTENTFPPYELDWYLAEETLLQATHLSTEDSHGACSLIRGMVLRLG